MRREKDANIIWVIALKRSYEAHWTFIWVCVVLLGLLKFLSDIYLVNEWINNYEIHDEQTEPMDSNCYGCRYEKAKLMP